MADLSREGASPAVERDALGHHLHILLLQTEAAQYPQASAQALQAVKHDGWWVKQEVSPGRI